VKKWKESGSINVVYYFPEITKPDVLKPGFIYMYGLVSTGNIISIHNIK